MSNNIFSFFSKSTSEQEPIKKLTSEMFSFLEQFPTPILLVDATGKIVFANPGAASLFHTKVSSLTSSHVDRFGLTMTQVRSLSDDKSAKKIVLEIVKPDAETLSVSVGASVLAATPFIMLTLEPVPYFRQLNSEKAFLSTVLDGYPAAITVQDLAGNCVLWSKKAEELFGHSSQEVSTHSVSEFLPAEIVKSIKHLDQQVQAGSQECSHIPLSYKDKQGEEVTLSICKEILRDAEGKPVFLLTSYENITEHYRKDQELLQDRALLRAVLENIPMGLYARDIDGEMTFWNQNSMKVLNEPNKDCVNRPHKYQTEEILEAHYSREQNILKDGQICEYQDEDYVDSEGKHRILHMIKIPLFDAGPKPLVLSIVEDITERATRERELERTNKFLSAVMENIPIGLYVRTGEGKMILQNKPCEKIFGVPLSFFDSKAMLPHEQENQVKEFLEREQRLLKDGGVLDIPEEEYVVSSGEKKLFHLIKVPITLQHSSEKFIITLIEDITERKEKDRVLLETKNTLQTILDHVPVAIYARKLDNSMSFINPHARELFPDEREYIAKEDFYGNREASMFKEGKILEFPEEWYTRMDGKKVLLHLVKVPVFDESGKPALVVTMAEDITERKAQEQAIQDSKNFLQMVINQLPVSLSVKDYDGKYILWNRKSEDLFGVQAQDVIGRTAYRKDINPDQAEFLRESDLRIFDNKKEQDIAQELISTAKEGVRIMHTVKTPVFNPDGSPNCLLTVSEDITAKTKMEKQIREASDKNTLLVENARDGVVILDDGKIIYTNRAFGKILGYDDLEELSGKNLLDFAQEEHRMFLKDKFDAVLSGAENASSSIEVHFSKKKGGEVETEFTAITSKYLGRRIILCFMRDVTSSNRILREVKAERECFRSTFEKSVTPAFILSSKGYISVMNEACRTLFGFTEGDKNFYRNVYMRPAFSLMVRKQMKLGQAASMQYTFDFERAAQMFPGRITGEGILPLTVHLVPINKRDMRDGTVEAEYIVSLERQEAPQPPKPVVAPLPPAKPAFTAPLPPAPPAPLPPATVDREVLVLPNSEPYVLCTEDFKIAVCNPLFCSLCQLDEKELLGQDLRKLFLADSKAVLEQDFLTLQKDGTLSNREYRIRLASGLETTAVRLTAVKDADGRYLFVLRNMAFHRQIMKILEERSAQLNALLEATNGVVFTVMFEEGHFGKIEEANKYLSEKVGFSHDELLRMSFAELFADLKTAGTTVTREQVLLKAEQEIAATGKTSFCLPVLTKEEGPFEGQITVTALDLPGKDAALVVLQDLSQQLDLVSKESKEAQELKCVRSALPGLYLKTDSDGRVLEVYSNLEYLNNSECEEIFLKKTPAQYWPEEAAGRALFSIKEALSINVNTRFEFEWSMTDKMRYFEATVTPIAGRAETVLWVKDVSDKHTYEGHVYELYRLTRDGNQSITEQVDKILEFGKKVFRADVGMVLRFLQAKNGKESVVIYVTANDFHLERHMEFGVGECLADVADGNVVLFSDLENASCTGCLHKLKGFGSLLAAPLYVGGKVQGALCFASRSPRRGFKEGSEELIGLMARLLSLRIELRQTGKMLGEASRSLAHTLEYVEMPAVMIDLDYQMTFVNKPMLEVTGRRTSNLLGRDFFAELIRNDDLSKQVFKSAERNTSGNAFQVRLELRQENGLYKDNFWDVFICKDSEGRVAGYALIVSSTK